MTKNFEYKEPEFKVVKAQCEDILTASGDAPAPAGNLDRVSAAWEMGTFTI
jgi:hypothetical protein